MYGTVILSIFFYIFMPVLLLANLGLSIACTIMLSKVRAKQEEIQKNTSLAKPEQMESNNIPIQPTPAENNNIVPQTPVQPQDQYEVSKIGMGIGLAFLGLIGLIIGICLYPERTRARETFIKSWLITFFVLLGASFMLGFGIYFLVVALITPIF